METASEATANSSLNNDPQAVVVRREPERDLVTWTAPSRLFRRYGRKAYVSIFSIVGIIGIVIFIAEGLMPVILLIALIFLFYVLSTVPPENIEYRVTNRGVRVAGKETPWQNIESFYFASKTGGEVLVFDTTIFPGKMELVMNTEIKETLRREISAYISYEEKPPSVFDKLIGWFSKKLLDSE